MYASSLCLFQIRWLILLVAIHIATKLGIGSNLSQSATSRTGVLSLYSYRKWPRYALIPFYLIYKRSIIKTTIPNLTTFYNIHVLDPTRLCGGNLNMADLDMQC
jgi:hypothetical protein